MAAITKAQLATKVLEHLSVVPLGQAASPEHHNYVKVAIDSVYDQLQDSGLAPYGLSAIPDWAQLPMMKYVAVEVGPHFGKAMPEGVKHLAKQEMSASVFGGPRGALPAKSTGY